MSYGNPKVYKPTTKASLVHCSAEKIQGQLLSFLFTILYINITSDKTDLYIGKRKEHVRLPLTTDVIAYQQIYEIYVVSILL